MLEAAVPAATFLLAVGTGWLAWQTQRSVRQSILGRLDQLAPSVIVTQAEIRDTVVATSSSGAGSRVLSAGTAWPLSRCGDESLGVRCTISVVNEGARSAMVRLATPDGRTRLPATPSKVGFQAEVDMAYPVSDPSPLGMTSSVVLSERGEWTIVPPGTLGLFTITYWAPAREWDAKAQTVRTNGGADAERFRFVIEVTAEPTSVLDRCEIEFSKLALWFKPSGGVIVAPSAPTGMAPPFPGTFVTVGSMTRQYPTSNRGLGTGLRLVWRRLRAAGGAAMRSVQARLSTRSGRARDEAEAVGSDTAERPGPGGGGAAAT